MTEQERTRYEQLKNQEHHTAKEADQFEVLDKMAKSESVVAQFRKNQQAPYRDKVARAENLAWEFYRMMDGQCYVAVGGLDSITLLLFLRRIGIKVPAISVSGLEDKSIQKVHKALDVTVLHPTKSKVAVIREFGFPVLSKEIAGKISHLQRPTERNKTIRHAIVTGETGAQGGWRTGTRMKLPDKWLRLFGGYENENEGTNYGKPDFLVSDKCCDYLKETPCNNYAKETGRKPFLGLMASEGGRRQKALMLHGCNYISKTTARSAPFATFNRDDILRLALEMNAWYLEHTDLFQGEPVESIIPEIYGEIVTGEDGKLKTTGAQRTGCSMCGFGCHMEQRPHRFDQLWKRNRKEWELWMHHIVQKPDGTWYGWDKVLDYIGVDWRNPAEYFKEDTQISFFDE